MTVAKSIALFVVAAVFEIGGCRLVWRGVRDRRGVGWVGLGILAPAGYGFVATVPRPVRPPRSPRPATTSPDVGPRLSATACERDLLRQ